MSERIELGISENYVGHWTINEALREIYQNAIDRQSKTDKPMISNYNEEKHSLVIGNNNTSLCKSTLVLGNSSKATDKTQIGAFGEGYKLALVVLLRNGFGVRIYNNNEIWIPSLEYSETFKTKVLIITIEEYNDKSNSLTFVIGGVKPRTYHGYTQYNLFLQPKRKSIKTPEGEVLLDDRNRAKIFIEGLFICNVEKNYRYGYNFKNGIIPVDRDRMKLDSFNIAWYTSKMLTQIDKEKEGIKMVKDLISEGAKETSYYSNHSTHNVKISSDLYSQFKEEYPNCVPVEDQEGLKDVEREYQGVKAVVVGEKMFGLYSTSSEYDDDMYMLEPSDIKTPNETLIKFMNDFSDLFSEALKVKYANELMPLSVNWKNK